MKYFTSIENLNFIHKADFEDYKAIIYDNH
jgi:hypothetical protein